MSMTIEEMDAVIQKHCSGYGECDNCKVQSICNSVFGNFTSNPKKCEEAYNLITNKTTNDIINHPSHYCRDGAMESIDEMVLVFGKEAVKNFCLCNCWKYRYRASSKNGEEDLKKSDWYMKKFRELSNE